MKKYLLNREEHVYVCVRAMLFLCFRNMFCSAWMCFKSYVLQIPKCNRKQVVKELARVIAQKNQLGSISMSILLLLLN